MDAGEREWGKVQARLVADRDGFGRVASSLYGGLPHVAGTTLLGRDRWVPQGPVPLEAVRVEWDGAASAPAVVDPVEGLPEGFRTFAEVLGALAPPKVFEDRPAYRLLDADLAGAAPVLRFGGGRYFDAVNVGESVAHELAAEVPGLPLRARVGDPCDLRRRTALMAITTLTVTRSGRYVLHWRDPAKVAHAGGLHQVMPVGVFQQVTDERADLDLWRSMVREYSEEFLGTPEEYEWDDQESWPFHQVMSSMRSQGRLRAYCLGLGVDPLTMAVDLLAAVVVEDEAFDELFHGMVAENDEGLVSLAAFDGAVPQPMQPAGAAALRLAWRHRAVLGVTPG